MHQAIAASLKTSCPRSTGDSNGRWSRPSHVLAAPNVLTLRSANCCGNCFTRGTYTSESCQQESIRVDWVGHRQCALMHTGKQTRQCSWGSNRGLQSGVAASRGSSQWGRHGNGQRVRPRQPGLHRARGRQQPWCARQRGARQLASAALRWHGRLAGRGPVAATRTQAGLVRLTCASASLTDLRACWCASAGSPDLRVCRVRHEGQARGLAHDAGAHAVGHAGKEEQEDGVLQGDVELQAWAAHGGPED